MIKLRLDSNGRIAVNKDDNFVRLLKWSDDVHSSNIILEKGLTENTVRLLTSKKLDKGAEVMLWFSQDLLAAMGISFLNPINILGEKNYSCHKCEKSFEFPNPLKVHLALSCGSLKVKELWKRLKISLESKIVPVDFIYKLSLQMKTSSLSEKPPSPVFSTRSNPSPDRCDPFLDTRPSSEPPRNSAFKPYIHSNTSQFDILSRQAAEIETIVSNLGQSKQGHLCLYCGKIYSRKYGLKIHIRTHTGFKPLKCKYCLRPFGDPSNLNKHVRLHAESDTPYRCHLCFKMLVRRRDLERHMKSRHNYNVDIGENV